MPEKTRTSEHAWLEGQNRAIALLRDIEDMGTAEMDALDQDRDGKPQSNVVFRHLISLLDMRDHDVLAAFSVVLTHYVGNAVHGANIDVDLVDRETRAPIAWDIPRRPLRLVTAFRAQEVSHGQA
jgi:hypothetical protein